MRKIVLLGLQTDANLGDALIANCTEHLVNKALRELSIDDAAVCQEDMRGFNYREYTEKQIIAEKKQEDRLFFLHRIYRKIIRTIAPDKYQSCKDRFAAGKAERRKQREAGKLAYRKKMSLKNACKAIDRNTSAVILCGGGLIKFGQTQKYAEMIAPYIDRANSLNIPVMFNAVGVEGFSADNEECRELCRILNLPCVKTVTTRDDIDTLDGCYISEKRIVTAKVPDPAVWASEIYPRERTISNTIGLGMVRGGLYRDHGGSKGTDELLGLWSEVIEELDRRRLDWRLFSNGLRSDQAFCVKLLRHIGRESETDRIAPAPSSVQELIDTVCSFDCVAASRLHAGITAYSYGIPIVEIVWNIKQRKFAEWAGCQDRFFDEDKVTSSDIINAIEQSLASPVPVGTIRKEDTYRYILSFIKDNLS